VSDRADLAILQPSLITFLSFLFTGSPDELIESNRGDTASTILKGWRDVPELKLLHLYYDVTPASYVSLVVCENGCLPSTSVLSVLANLNKEKQ
jgi:translation initiation factor eIF-2B subunit delta